LHAALYNGDLLPWVEADAAEKERGQRLRRKRPTVSVKAPEHPYNGGPDLLYSVLPDAALSTGLEGGKLQWAVAWLPSDAEGPIPSSDQIAPRAGRKARRLAPWAVSTLGMVAHMTHGWFLGYDRGEKLSPGWQMGEDLRFWRRALEFAGAMVVRQQFLPAVLETWEIPGRWWPYWTPVYEAEDLKRLELLVEAMPVAARALRRDRRRRPQERPRLLMRDFVTDMVDHLVLMGSINSSVWEHYVRPQRPRKTVPVDERWLEALMTPDLELKGESAELQELQTRVEEWREAVSLLPPTEDVLKAPAIGLPPAGEGFWKGRALPEDFVGPVEAPREPALILRRLGEIPGWRGESRLNDTIEPVYQAASRYALEYVFGQKPEPRVRRG
jgi:hypothetical protein